MSRQTNKHDPKLKALLDKEKNREPAADGFEEEALQGFATLGSEQEALDLKAELDQRIHRDLFAAKKENTPRVYWMAAAGLALVVGLSAYFILSKNPVEEKEMAIMDVSVDTVRHATEQSYEQKAAEFKSVAPDVSRDDKSKANRMPGAQPPAPVEITSTLKGAKDIAAAPVAPPAAEKADVGLAYSPAKTESDEDLETVSTRNKQAEQEVKVEDGKEAVGGREERKKASNAKVKAYSSANEPKPTASNAEGSAVKKEAAADTLNIYYEGGLAELHRQLTPRLISKNLDKHFEATLFIGFNGRVSKVEFTKATGISQEEQYEITYVIQSLDQFRFRNRPARSEVSEFKISR